MCLSFVTLIGEGYAQAFPQEKHIRAALRKVGHQVLLHVGDSTSRVLPITYSKGEYRIPFESEFAFRPEELVKTIDSIMAESKLSSGYIVEAVQCSTKEVVYSYEVNDLTDSAIISCSSRSQPESCYELVFTLRDQKHTPPAESSVTRSNPWSILALCALCGLVGVGFFFFWKLKTNTVAAAHWIPLGISHFDPHTATLIIEQQHVELTGKEADLLMLLYNSANTTVEREVLLHEVWGDNGDYVGRTLDVFISKLRKKLEVDPQVKIVNIRGVGYKLVVHA